MWMGVSVMTMQHTPMKSIPERSLTLYVEHVIACAHKRFEIERLQREIDAALDARDKCRFYQLSHELTHLVEQLNALEQDEYLNV
jgi:uncharacterized protein YpiB (UPF0302 family)